MATDCNDGAACSRASAITIIKSWVFKMTDIENTVLGIVQDTADYLDEPVLLSSRFMDIGINSVLFIKIIVNVEDTYDLEISEVEIVRLLEENVSSLAQYIQKEVAQK